MSRLILRNFLFFYQATEAFIKSIYATPILLPRSISSVHFSKTCSKCRVVDLSEIKPNVNRLFVFMCFTILSWIIDSSNIPGTHRSIISWVLF